MSKRGVMSLVIFFVSYLWLVKAKYWIKYVLDIKFHINIAFQDITNSVKNTSIFVFLIIFKNHKPTPIDWDPKRKEDLELASSLS